MDQEFIEELKRAIYEPFLKKYGEDVFATALTALKELDTVAMIEDISMYEVGEHVYTRLLGKISLEEAVFLVASLSEHARKEIEKVVGHEGANRVRH
jgi:TnpA family transposase